KIKLFAYANLPPWTHQTLPLVRLLGKLLSEQHLDPPAQKIARSGIAGTQGLRPRAAPPPVQSRRENPGIVEHHQVIGTKQLWKIAKTKILNLARAALEMKHSRARTIGKGVLRNPFFGKLVIEF